MKSTFNVIYYIRRDKLKKDGTAPIFCRITISQEKVSFNIKAAINTDIWESSTGRATGKSREAFSVNKIIDSYTSLINEKHNEIFDRDGIVSAEGLKNSILGISSSPNDIPIYLLEVYLRHNEEMAKLVGSKYSPAILQKYKCVYKKIQTFLKSKYNLSDIKLKDIKHNFLTDFETYLRIEGNCQTNTIGRNMRLLKKIINIAKNNGWIIADPYANYKIHFEKVDRGYLTEEEIKAIIEKDFSIDRIEKVRDIFIFSCFTGLSYADIYDLTYDDIKPHFDNNLWIMKKRVKTNTDITVPLMDIPLSIIEKYRGKQKSNKVLPTMCNQKMNSYLKEIADLCGIEKHLTYHMSRHTFATTFLSLGIPIESVSKMLGHTKIQTTQIYARITNNKIANEMNAIAGKLKTYESKSAIV